MVPQTDFKLESLSVKNHKPHNKPNEAVLLGLVLVLGSILFLMIWPGWQWCFMGLVTASLFHPWVRKIKTYIKSERPLAVFILLSFFAVISVVPLVAIILSVDINALSDFEGIKAIVETARTSFNNLTLSFFETLRDFLPNLNPTQVKTTAQEVLRSLSGMAGRGVSDVIGAGPALATNLFIFTITFYYTLLSFRKLRMGLLRVPVLKVSTKSKLLRSFSATAYSSVVAAGATSAVQTVILGTGMLALGYKHWALGTVLSFFAAFVPVIGTLPISTIIVIQFAIQGNSTNAVIFAVIALVAGISDNIVRPLFLKGSSDMHPWLAFVAVIGGLSVFGIWGLFIGPIMVGLLKTSWSEWVHSQKNKIS